MKYKHAILLFCKLMKLFPIKTKFPRNLDILPIISDTKSNQSFSVLRFSHLKHSSFCSQNINTKATVPRHLIISLLFISVPLCIKRMYFCRLSMTSSMHTKIFLVRIIALLTELVKHSKDMLFIRTFTMISHKQADKYMINIPLPAVTYYSDACR